MAAILLGAVATVGHVAMMNQRAATAADLAALAAADAARGLRDGIPCEEAERTAASNGARMTDCAAAPGIVGGMDVRVSVGLAPAVGFLGPARGLARAGPPPEGEEAG
ncbi:hypothetical protein NBM05_13430 [Rothia sp. AR01]|uniref:Helicase/secretion neighborhood TadE-like protein n=1 Tax=Rothia santali TaxID=2949643 RepID=A0A9X2KJ85_9MICC|nr:hypothetical protein [Rothia santali]